MRTYLVGGAIRDRLLGRPIKEQDYLVVGATPEQMLSQGYRQVGKDFPVFLHPVSGAEYALARLERHGSQAADAGVTLEEDLSRRDLTLNALAEDEQGRLIDLFGGVRDLEQRWLRHVSPAFAEDPIRVLRVARFMARYGELGFRVAPETLDLMGSMVAAGQLDHLVPERVWSETQRALGETRPSAFLETLRACGALARVFPEIDRLWGVPQPSNWHPEVDTGAHLLMVVNQARRLSDDPLVVFAALTHDLGKGNSPPAQWPHHQGHEGRSVVLLDGLCDRLRVPGRFRDLARQVARYHSLVHRADQLTPSAARQVLEGVDAFRRPARLEPFLLACEADFRGRLGFAERPYPQADRFRAWLGAASQIDLTQVLVPGLAPEAIRDALAAARERAIQQV